MENHHFILVYQFLMFFLYVYQRVDPINKQYILITLRKPWNLGVPSWKPIGRPPPSIWPIWVVAAVKNVFYFYIAHMIIIIEGSLEVKLPTIWTDGKAEVGRVREEKGRREKIREEKEWEERRCRRAKRQESRETLCFFRWFVAPAGRKVGSLKRRVRSHLARWEMKNCTPLWHEAHPEVNNVQNTSCSDGFWKLRCRKSARRYGAKHISKSKCTKHTNVGPLLEVEMSKKCTPLWREARFQVKMGKTHQLRTTFGSWDVEKVHAVVARSTCPSQNVQNISAPDHFWKLRCRKSARRCGAKHNSTSKVQKN